MAWTQTDVDALKAAIAAGRGARTIQFSDQTVSFHSIPEMLQLLAVMQAEVSGHAATTRYATSRKDA